MQLPTVRRRERGVMPCLHRKSRLFGSIGNGNATQWCTECGAIRHFTESSREVCDDTTLAARRVVIYFDWSGWSLVSSSPESSAPTLPPCEGCGSDSCHSSTWRDMHPTALKCCPDCTCGRR